MLTANSPDYLPAPACVCTRLTRPLACSPARPLACLRARPPARLCTCSRARPPVNLSSWPILCENALGRPIKPKRGLSQQPSSKTCDPCPSYVFRSPTTLPAALGYHPSSAIRPINEVIPAKCAGARRCAFRKANTGEYLEGEREDSFSAPRIPLTHAASAPSACARCPSNPTRLS